MAQLGTREQSPLGEPALAPMRRRWQKYAYGGWLVCAALAWLFFLVALPLGYAQFFSGAVTGTPVDAPALYVAAMSFIHGAVSIFCAVVSLVLATLLFWKRRTEPVALFVSFYLLAYGIALAGPLEALNNGPHFIAGSSDLLAGPFISNNLVSYIQSAVIIPSMPLFLYLFPSGRFVPRWTRAPALLLLPVALPLIFANWMTEDEVFTAPMVIFVIIYLGLVGVGVYAQIYRYRHAATPIERQQTKWMVFGLLLTLLLMWIGFSQYTVIARMPAGVARPWWVPLNELGWWLSLTIIPLSLALSVMRYRLWDIDLIVNRALVGALLSGSVILLYILLVVVLGGLFGSGGNTLVSLLATALVAVLFQPLRLRLQRGVNRLLYGERDDPYAALARLGQRLEATLATESLLPTIVETVAQALRLPYASIALKEAEEFRVVAEYHAPQSPLVKLQEGLEVIPLAYQSEVTGQLSLSQRAPGESFTPADRRLLAQYAHQAGVAAYTVRLTRELQHSRARLVVMREEERRRIRRDLHDGLGPALASLAMQADNAREWTHTDPVRTDAALADITVNAQAALQDIRRLVYNLRPPALDELGLVGALRQSVANVTSGLHLVIDAPVPMPALSAAVEVAAYRIAHESLNNVVSHSHARNCTLRISVQDELTLEISDDGIGLPVDVRSGVGMISMRERAAELGGSCIIESMRDGGTRVLARLPLAHQQA